MDISLLLFGVLPLVVFVIIDSFAGVRAGVISAITFAVAELLYTIVVYGEIDNLTIGATLLVAFFGFLSFKSNNPIYIKLQPVFLGTIFGVALLVMQLLGKPLLVLMMEKYQYMIPKQLHAQIVNPVFLAMLARLSGVLAVGFLLHAALVAYAAFYMNKWWWIIFRGIGLYVMMALCVVYVRVL